MLAFEIFYVALMTVIIAYGVHRYWLVLGSLRHLPPAPTATGDHPAAAERPTVLIQLPVYNEEAVVLDLIDSAAEVDWDRDRLEIQVLDDSDDGSSAMIADRVARWRSEGVNIQHVQREERSGYKAGALAEGLRLTGAPYVAIFDADFQIPADFLRRTIPLFEEDSRVGMVQARWGFLNPERSLLTRIQGLLLDGHFHVEHRARAAAGRFFNFNGTAGVWRRAAIDDAGGWRADTITEDLDLSLRAWLAGWRFRYLDDLEVPSALPEAMSAFKIQQNRWVTGSVQTAKQLLRPILGSSLRPIEKLDLVAYLTGNLTYIFLLLLALSLPAAVLLRLEEGSTATLLWADIPFFVMATVSVFVFYSRARRPELSSASVHLVRIPSLMALGLGMALHNSRAIVKGLFSSRRVFESTPKGGEGREAKEVRRRRRRLDPLTLLEPVLALYVLVTVAIHIRGGGTVASIPFLALFVWGYLFVFTGTLRARRGAES